MRLGGIKGGGAKSTLTGCGGHATYTLIYVKKSE